eukprot:m.14268 g.14268  ORF g.14268 m.14268 type:complete len:56 (-) comp4278_c0_seq1:166-333(-)
MKKRQNYWDIVAVIQINKNKRKEKGGGFSQSMERKKGKKKEGMVVGNREENEESS